MALKDKLMTLEDFKAVRDVDVASNSAQFTEIKADLTNVSNQTDRDKIDLKFQSILDGNLVDESSVTYNRYINASGDVVYNSNANYGVTEYIPLYGKNISGNWMVSANLMSYTIYDENFNKLRYAKNAGTTYTYQSGDAYIRLVYIASSTEHRAYYGNVVKDYVAFAFVPQKDAKDILASNTNIAKNNERIDNIFDVLDVNMAEGKLLFEAFSSRKPATAATSFLGFATRYSFNGSIYALSVSGNFSSSDDSDVTAKISLYDGDFDNVLASKTVTVESDTTYVKVTLDEPITISGNFYIVVEVTSANGYYRVTSADISAYCTADSDHKNKYINASRPGTWDNLNSGYNVDLVLYGGVITPIPETVVFIGSDSKCKYAKVQDALNAITDDSADKPYTLIIMPGTYESFSMRFTNAERTVRFGRVRYISLIGLDAVNTIFTDNRGNYLFSPCEIWTNGTVKNLTFVDITDADHHTQEENRDFAYAMHCDFGTCHTIFENCYFTSNAGPAAGLGTWHDGTIEFYNCRFVSLCDGTFGVTGHGALFIHTQTSNTDLNRNNQKLIVHDCVMIGKYQSVGARFAVITGYEGTYEYEFQNIGCFGNAGASVSLQAPDNDLLSDYNFNNLPSILNTVS